MADNEEKIVGSAIPKRTIKLKPANLSAVAGASAPTIKLKTPAAPAPAAPEGGAAPVATDTAKLARRTIKLVPQSGSPLGTPAAASATPVTPAAAPAPAATTDTAKLSKRTIKLTPASGSGAPAASASAPTIKLNSPAAHTAPSAEQTLSTDTAKLSKRTIKLTPASGSGASAPSSPSAPTIKLHSPSAPAAPSAPSAPTIKLTSPQAAAEEEVSTGTSKIARQTAPQQEGAPAGAETVKLRPQSQQTIRLTPSTTGGLQLKKPVAKTGLAAAEAPDELVQKMSSSRKQVENPVATVMCMISSIVALLILGFVCFALYAQYSNFFEGSDINVPGLERKTGSANGK